MSFRRFLGLTVLGVLFTTPLIISAQAGAAEMQKKKGKRNGGGNKRGTSKKGATRKKGGGFEGPLPGNLADTQAMVAKFGG